MLRREPLGKTLIFAHNKFAIPIFHVQQKEELPKHSEVQIATAIPTSVGLRVPLNLGRQEKKEMGKRFRDISVSFQKKITMCKQASLFRCRLSAFFYIISFCKYILFFLYFFSFS